MFVYAGAANYLFYIIAYYYYMFKSDWYYGLQKPPLTPPDWVFQPVWTILYFTIFLALALYIVKPKKNKRSGYVYFALQLILNLLWAPAFFYLKNIKLALITIVFLDIFVILTIKKFYSVSNLSGVVLIPYFFWVLFATYLNAGYFFYLSN